LEKLRQRYPFSLSLVIRHFPLSSHAHATAAAMVAVCAGEQGRFEAVHHLLLAEWPGLVTQTWEYLAARAWVPNVALFVRCIESANPDSVLGMDLYDADRLGVSVTPTFLVEHEAYVGVPWDLEAILLRHLPRTEGEIRKGPHDSALP
jgi:protein-disulfide isomerase